MATRPVRWHRKSFLTWRHPSALYGNLLRWRSTAYSLLSRNLPRRLGLGAAPVTYLVSPSDRPTLHSRPLSGALWPLLWGGTAGRRAFSILRHAGASSSSQVLDLPST